MQHFAKTHTPSGEDSHTYFQRLIKEHVPKNLQEARITLEAEHEEERMALQNFEATYQNGVLQMNENGRVMEIEEPSQ